MAPVTNDVTNIIFNIGRDGGRGPRPMGPRGGMEMAPVLAFSQPPMGDFCDFGGHGPGHCCCGDSELADFGNSKMGASIGKAAEKNAKYNGIANIIQSVLGGGGLFGNGGLSNLLNGGLSSIFAMG